MKRYELSVLFMPEVEAAMDAAAGKVKKIVEDAGGKIVSGGMDGKKRTAYPVRGNEFAVYYFVVAELPSSAPAKIDSVLNITDGVLRHLLVSEDERKLKYLARQEARKQKEESKEE